MLANDLRLATKIIQILRKEHGIRLSYQDRDLASTLASVVDHISDPIVDALWAGISLETRANANKTKSCYRGATQVVSDVPNAAANQAKLRYRGASVNTQSAPEPVVTQRPDGERKYRMYRGTKLYID